ncbi:MAG: hypothetical protein LBG77_08535 [Dysgonamonadaceae bacterium]|jgi:CRISPR-associated endoribonuclease Cas6|nr:hypothetical protein [Dysgonamonadaceae bacterium]
MRFLLTEGVDSEVFGNQLPLNYQYELNAFIYRAIAQADSEYAGWLHENGFRLNGRSFKLFTFSRIYLFHNITSTKCKGAPVSTASKSNR